MLAGSLVGFALGPSGRALGLVVALVAWTAYQRQDAASTARSEAAAQEAARFEAAVAEANRAAAEARARADRTEQELSELERLRDDAMQGSDGCTLSDADRDRLRAIR